MKYSAFSLEENRLQKNVGRESSIPVRVGHLFFILSRISCLLKRERTGEYYLRKCHRQQTPEDIGTVMLRHTGKTQSLTDRNGDARPFFPRVRTILRTGCSLLWSAYGF